MNSIKIKLVAICIAVLLIVMIISGSFMLMRVKANETQKSMEQLIRYAQAINDEILQVYDTPFEFITAYENRTSLNTSSDDIQSCIMDGAGQPIAPFNFITMQLNDSAVVSALAGEAGFLAGKKALDLNGTEQEWLCYAKPVDKNGTRYVIYTRMNAKPMNDNLSDLMMTIVIMVALALFLTGLLWSVFANTLTAPIVTLTRHAREMARGNLDNEIAPGGKDEIGQLIENFNFMAKELHLTVSTMVSEKNKVEAILHNMTDGVLAYDAQGNMIHANSTSGELLQTDEPVEWPLCVMLSQLGFDADEVYRLSPDQIKESTVPVGDRYVAACITPYVNPAGQVEGFVIVLQDVTKHTKLDNMRKEFVANVSHELRTPLTNVKTYAETLMDGAINDPSVAIGFLKVIDDETQRMSLLVTDLLELSKLENNQLSLDLEITDLVGLVQQSIRQNRVLADKKQQQITFDMPNKPYFIEADVRRINQVLTNILTNSVKYSPENTVIDVTMEETDRFYRVFIKDHGIGIPKDDLRHIFERFYRVDKARSRAMGGTGLGLAIAREIMEAHDGRITVSSEPGSGTTMVLRFEKCKESIGAD